jgi:pimeloyl-ACP methyl ester carboxylesterase
LTVLDVRRVTTARGPVEFAFGQSRPSEHAPVAESGVVVLVHGMPGSWRQAVPLAEDLAGTHTVILPSRPGYGETPLASGRTPAEQAALYAALLDALGLERAAIVGISGGGPSAVAFAQGFPERTTSLILLCALTGHLMPVPAILRLAAALPPLAAAATAARRRKERRVLADADAIDARIRSDLTPAELARMADDPRIREDLIGFLEGHAAAPAGRAGFVNDVRQIQAAGQSPPAVDRITAPTLVMHGTADPTVPLPHAEFHASAIAGARLVTVPDTGHVFLLTHRRETSAALLAHLEANP